MRYGDAVAAARRPGSSSARFRTPPRRVRRLGATELSSYDVVPPDVAARVRVVHAPVFPGRFAGITLGHWVILDRPAPANGASALLAHELVHVRQWAELGLVGFLARYLAGFAVGLRRHRRWHRAYLDIPLEVEARAQAEAWLQRRHSLPGRGRSPF